MQIDLIGLRFERAPEAVDYIWAGDIHYLNTPQFQENKVECNAVKIPKTR